MSGRPGFVRGRHYTAHLPEFHALKRAGHTGAAESLVREILEAAERESQAQNLCEPPSLYRELAVLLRKRGAVQEEVRLLDRFTARWARRGLRHPQLEERRRNALLLLQKERNRHQARLARSTGRRTREVRASEQESDSVGGGSPGSS